MFNAIVIDKVEGNYHAALVTQEESALPEGDVTVAIDYSSINYKDALAITGRGPIVRKFPMVPGIDFAGTVIESVNPAYKAGDKVLLTGWGVGEKHWGGLAGKARVSAEWLAPLPQGSDARHVMAIGTAGFTAMLCVEAVLHHGVKPEDGPVLVTGASGGVGSCAALILAQLGYQVVASTGRPAEADWLRNEVGVSEVIDRAELSAPGKPLQKERWVAAVDTVGSHTLANVCASIQYGGIVAACGMAQGLDLPASVAPFILRNVALQGIDSVMVSTEKRPALWEKACKYLPMAKLAALTTEYPLTQAIDVAEALLAGKVRGRAVIKC
ncbi:MDR family oxidoreductase [Candidatus Symbiopectobacterium sp. NZEC151]|uniref:acrylyl-CoA reductase (NADPH) n=1 Tax=Candidatus Symbiopectobacterium sp. NZEC151 TaxID=2820470 RepID=UPI00222706D2|nr:MDR family oxidoreductase [Candidatus Symbiopectobacterium sp. NZEC151]MCW2476756.1 oxidoreductase [Candidatus Symbiopectobacterium sp. NZEC151]